MKVKNLHIILLKLFILFSASNSIAQKFADKKYYLVDSLNFQIIAPEDKEIIEEALKTYHQSIVDTVKINAINEIVNGSWDVEVWVKYNSWIYTTVNQKLNNPSKKKSVDYIYFMKMKAATLNNYGYYYEDLGLISEAINYYNKSIAIRSEIKDDFGRTETLITLGLLYGDLGNYNKAFELLYESLKLSEKNGFKEFYGNGLNSIGGLFENQADYIKALEYLKKSYNVKLEIDEPAGIALILNNLGSVYFKMDSIDNAIEHWENSLIYFEKSTEKSGKSIVLNNLGSIYKKQGNFDKALIFFQECLKLSQEINEIRSIVIVQINIGELYLQLNKTKEGKSAALEAYKTSKQLGFPETISKSASLLRKFALMENDFKSAYEYFQEEVNMNDSIQNETNYKLTQQKEAQYAYDKKYMADSVAFAKEKELDSVILQKQQAELAVKENQQWLLIVGIIAIVIFSAFTYNRFLVSKKQNAIIHTQKIEVERQRTIVEEKNLEITDSINYAKRIQTAILPPQRLVNELIKENFILYKPKDVVSGDFYWMHKTSSDEVLFAAADCTGHGVPGAMVSVICNNSLNRAVREFGLTNTGLILDKTRELVIQEFEKSDVKVNDGMDISLCKIKGTELEWSGANNPLWIFSSNSSENIEFSEIKPNKQPISQFDNIQTFTTHHLKLNTGDSIYVFTDGFADQFGGPKGKKLMYKPFKELLLSIQDKPMEEQKTILEKHFENWKGEHEQVDDVCIIGVRIC